MTHPILICRNLRINVAAYRQMSQRKDRWGVGAMDLASAVDLLQVIRLGAVVASVSRLPGK